MKITNKKLLMLMMIVLFTIIQFQSYATKWIVNVQNFSFSPSSLPSVYLGDTVRWVWISGSHTTTNTVIPPSAPTWDQPLNVSNQFFEYVPTLVGTYNYKCTPHEGMGMVGSFIVSPLPFISLNLKVFLEGPFIGSGMNTELNISGLIPLNQPYNVSPWNYTGTENVASIPNASIVDWVLVELRETTGDASTATADKQIQRQAAFVLSDGSIVGIDGSSLITYTGSITSNLFVVVWHRNHLAVMSSGALLEAGGEYAWDFTNQLSKAYLDGQKSIGAGMFGIISGDSDADGIVGLSDKNNDWNLFAGVEGYKPGDLNLDSQVNNKDKDSFWVSNIGATTKIPTIISFTCGDNLIDVRDGQSYITVQIENQCWMAENLNIGTMILGTETMTQNAMLEKYCYNNIIANCNVYGGLYQWNEMMQYSTTPGVPGICPAGWHVPTDAEWTVLTNFLGGWVVAGGKMKTMGTIESGTGLWYSPNSGATNENGFYALPGGNRDYTSFFYNMGDIAGLWCSTEIGTDYAWYRLLTSGSIDVSAVSVNKSYGYSVRCVKD